jgi:hypothetical protein
VPAESVDVYMTVIFGFKCVLNVTNVCIFKNTGDVILNLVFIAFLHRFQNGSGAHPASYPTGTRGSFPGGKAAGA